MVLNNFFSEPNWPGDDGYLVEFDNLSRPTPMTFNNALFRVQ